MNAKHARRGSGARQFVVRSAAAAGLALGLAACAATGLGDPRLDGPFRGAVVAEEPLAARVARDVLFGGGNAADAAVAALFAYAVTLPSMAGIAGGGVCLVRPADSPAEALEFYATTPNRLDLRGDRPAAVPGTPRGLFVLNEKYGASSFESLIAPAAQLARDGVPVSRTLAAHLAAAGGFLRADPAASRTFFHPDGRPLDVGDTLRRPELHGLLTALARRGVGAFYQGQLGESFREQAFDVGAVLSADDLRGYRPRWRPAEQVEIAGRRLVAPPPPAAAGAVTAQALFGLIQAAPESDADRAHATAEALARAFADRRLYAAPGAGRPEPGLGASAVFDVARMARTMRSYDAAAHTSVDALPNPPGDGQAENFASASVAVIDQAGLAVSCSASVNNPFGIGRLVKGKGVFPAADPAAVAAGPVSLGPVMVLNANGRIEAIVAFSGGVMGPSAAAQALYGALIARTPLRDALRAPRLHHSGAPDILYYEGDFDPRLVDALALRGHEVRAFPGVDGVGPGRANVITCPGGFDPENEDAGCAAAVDPRAGGLAFGAAIVPAP